MSTREELYEVRAELEKLERALEVGKDNAILISAVRVVNRHGLVREFVDELLAFPGRMAVAEDIGFVEFVP